MSGSESGETTETPVETPADTVLAVIVKPPQNCWNSLGKGAEHFQLVTGEPLTDEQIKALWAETGIDHVETGANGLTNVLVTTRELSAKLVKEVLGDNKLVSLVKANL